MIISKKYAKKLVREGKATETCTTTDHERLYQAVDRHYLQRVDHYRLA